MRQSARTRLSIKVAAATLAQISPKATDSLQGVSHWMGALRAAGYSPPYKPQVSASAAADMHGHQSVDNSQDDEEADDDDHDDQDNNHDKAIETTMMTATPLTAPT